MLKKSWYFSLPHYVRMKHKLQAFKAVYKEEDYEA